MSSLKMLIRSGCRTMWTRPITERAFLLFLENRLAEEFLQKETQRADRDPSVEGRSKGIPPDVYYKMADKALYEAKRSGKNHFVFQMEEKE